ncbi:hypothetical protein BGZ50_006468 [Haplosporangium sp. Z 11]|nr:hypothetical protein BGZ50_006468 [Haplosporangium sp. Z 11]
MNTDARVPGMGESDDGDPLRFHELGALKATDENFSPCARTNISSPVVLSQYSSIIPSVTYDPDSSVALPQMSNYTPVPAHIGANLQQQQPQNQYAAGSGIQVGTDLQQQQHQHSQLLQQSQGLLYGQEKAEIVLEMPPPRVGSRKPRKLRGSRSLNEKYAQMKHDMSLMTSGASYKPLPRIARSGNNRVHGGVPTSIISHGPILDPIHQDINIFGYQGFRPMNNAICRTKTSPMSTSTDTVGYQSNHATSDVLYDPQLFGLQKGVDMIPSLVARTGTESVSGFADSHQAQSPRKRMRIENDVPPVSLSSSAVAINGIHGMDAVRSGAYLTPHFRTFASSSSRTTRPNPIVSSAPTQYIPYSAPRRQILDEDGFYDEPAFDLALSEQGLSIQEPTAPVPSFVENEPPFSCSQTAHGPSMPLQDDTLTWSPRYERFERVGHVDSPPSLPHQYPELQTQPSLKPGSEQGMASESMVSDAPNSEDVLDARAMTIRERIRLMGSRMRTCATARVNRFCPDPLLLPSLDYAAASNGIRDGHDSQEREWKHRQIYRFESSSKTRTSKHRLTLASLLRHERETKKREQDDCAATPCFAEMQNLPQPLSQRCNKHVNISREFDILGEEGRSQSSEGMPPTQEAIAIATDAMSTDAVSCNNSPPPYRNEDDVRNETTSTDAISIGPVIL